MATIEIKAKKGTKTLKLNLNDTGIFTITSPNVNFEDIITNVSELAVFMSMMQRARALLLQNGLDLISFEEVK